jgi:squalene-hopene/tetraprenyl-beta-curcumene cyclase
VTYLLARPALRRALGESQPTTYEKGLLDGLRARLEKQDPKQSSPTTMQARASQRQGVEAILAALFLALDETRGTTLSATTKQAFDRLWSVQLREGQAAGAWAWFDLTLDPWEMPDSAFYGAALAALAVGTAPAEYREQPEIRERLNALTEYLQREQQTQPLHNRLTLLWASSKLPAVLPVSMRRSIIDEVLEKQQADGGWTLESLGPWKPHAQAPPRAGSNSYATGFAAFILQTAGVAPSHPGMVRALGWLRSHQDRQSGHWAADSMNKQYEPDSIPVRFMRDAATAFATLALLEGR